MHSALLLAIAALPFLGADALKPNVTLRCGKQTKNTPNCKGSVFGNCCSKAGVCGSSSLHCGVGCQVGFGDCTSTKSTTKKPFSSIKSSTSSTTVTTVSVTLTSASSTLSTPSATSILSVVTSSPAPTLSSSTTSSPAPATSSPLTPDVKVSTDGSCGGTGGFTCSGSPWGNCCSEYGWCGSTGIYCDAGCNSAFGDCNGASSSVEPSSSSTLTPSSFVTSTRTTPAIPSSTQAVSTNGECGASSNGLTCLGSEFGDCCSQYGYCGSTSAFCGTGCQSGFGKCDAPPAPGLTCGVKGFANKAEYYASSFNLIPTADVSTCANLCLAEAECQSYIFNVDLQNCAYLRYSLSEGEFIATDETEQLFWDRACAEA
ncbi:hypothetical protein OPT61_g2355 [Boeremia exigua]|uniref:Uncharacterized protein n=1 Tax=Boeremia exigua TaxID=749465 RepID=A0ACC2ILU3_9PLEO|nr:hypothetical protein OPT61_g2355 [Boeremia exigua]